MTNTSGKVWILRMKKRSFLSGWAEWYLDGGVVKTIGRTIIILGIIFALVWIGIGMVEMNQAADAEWEARYEKAYAAQQEKEYNNLVKAAERARKRGEEPAKPVPPSLEEHVVETLPKVEESNANYSSRYTIKHVFPTILVLAVTLTLGYVMCRYDKIGKWFIKDGALKAVGRVFTVIGVVAALVITSIGYVDMYLDAEVERLEKYDKKYVKQQEKDYKALVKAAEAAEKAGEEVPAVPADASEVKSVIDPVELDMDDYIAPFITGRLVWAIAIMAGCIGLGWFISNIRDWVKAMIAAGWLRTLAGACFWVGAIIAVVILLMGLVKIVKMEDLVMPALDTVVAGTDTLEVDGYVVEMTVSQQTVPTKAKWTLPIVGRILLDGYVVWSVVALGAGIALRWLLLRLVPTMENAFVRVGSKLRFSSRVLFVLTMLAFPAMLIVGVCQLVLANYVCGAVLLGAAVVVLACGWVCSLALDALGVTHLVMEPQAKEAEARELARRNAATWVCANCGTVNPRGMVCCDGCGEIKPADNAE